MVLKDVSYMEFMYNNPIYLTYLRYHPHWYKILYYDPMRMKEFLSEAQVSMKITTQDRLKKFEEQLNFISQLTQLMK